MLQAGPPWKYSNGHMAALTITLPDVHVDVMLRSSSSSGEPLGLGRDFTPSQNDWGSQAEQPKVLTLLVRLLLK
jgi:hypothetical protein